MTYHRPVLVISNLYGNKYRVGVCLNASIIIHENQWQTRARVWSFKLVVRQNIDRYAHLRRCSHFWCVRNYSNQKWLPQRRCVHGGPSIVADSTHMLSHTQPHTRIYQRWYFCCCILDKNDIFIREIRENKLWKLSWYLIWYLTKCN